MEVSNLDTTFEMSQVNLWTDYHLDLDILDLLTTYKYLETQEVQKEDILLMMELFQLI